MVIQKTIMQGEDDMNVSKELLEKAKAATSAEELLELAKAENIEISAEEAAKAFAELNRTGELSDEELDNVSGGCGKSPRDGNRFGSEAEVTYKYSIGDIVNAKLGMGTVTCKIVAQGTDSGVFTRARNRTYYATYQVEVIDNWICSNGNIWINEVDIVE